MPPEIGALRYWHIEKEASFGAGMAGAGTCIPALDGSQMGTNTEHWRPRMIIGVPRPKVAIARRKWAEGTIKLPLYPNYAKALLDWGLERETFSNGFDLKNSYAIKECSQVARHYKGCKIKTLSLAASLDAPELIASFGVIGTTEVACDTFVRGALPVGAPYALYQMEATCGGEDISALFEGFEISVDTGLFGENGPIGSDMYPLGLKGGFESADLSASIQFDPDTLDLRGLFRADTELSLAMVFTNGTLSGNKVLTITAEAFIQDNSMDEMSAEELVMHQIKVPCHVNASDEMITYSEA